MITLILTALSAFNVNLTVKSHYLFSVFICPPPVIPLSEDIERNFDLLWSLCGSLSVNGYPIVLGDLNGDLGNSLVEKGTNEPNERGRFLPNFADYFNVCPVNLLSMCEGPHYSSFCGKYRSAIDCTFLP